MSDPGKKRVLIVGLGGLGVPAAMALARAHNAELVLIDPDPVELSNLPRQVLYREADIGTLKVAAAALRLRERNHAIALETHPYRLEPANAAGLIAGAAFVIDATDDPPTKFLVNDACISAGVPFVSGGAIMWTGQAMTVIAGRTACLRCIFEEPPDEEEGESCRDAGIIGPVAGAIGEVQALEAARLLSGQMPALAGKMLTYDGKIGRIRITEIAARSGCSCGAAAAVNDTVPIAER
jgi:molybdopterin-synthase adenylyltransferase